MSYLVLARKYRPATFDEVVGQEGVVRILSNAIRLDRVAHAYLFCGARGVGKTTVARILAKALNCEHGPTPEPDNSCTSCKEIAAGISQDVFEIDGASNTGVDDVRTLRDNSQYLPAHSRFKIYIIDEVHMLSVSAFNALLKTLEEPPAHVKFIFATTEPHRIPMTVLSRCQRFDFKRIPAPVIADHLHHILEREGAHIEEEGIRAIAREAAGSVRDALSLTDQVLAFGGENITTDAVVQALGLAASSLYADVIDCVVEHRPDDLMRLVEQLFDQGHDLKRFLEGMLWHVRQLILYRTLQDPDPLVDVLPDERERLRQQAARAEALRWHQVFDVLSGALAELGRNPYPRVVIETALLRLTAIEPLVEIEGLVRRVEALARRHNPGRSAPAGKGRPPQDTGSGGRGFSRPAPPASSGPASAQPAPARPAPAKPAPTPPTRETRAESDGAGEPSGSWEKLVVLVSKRRPSLGSVLQHASPLDVSPQQVRIALEPGSFFADQMKSDRNRRDLQRFCQEFFGADTRVVVEERSDGTDESLAAIKDKEARHAQQQMRDDALSHPMVREAIRIFGAEVTGVRPAGGQGDES